MEQEKETELGGAVALVIGTGESAAAMARSLIVAGAHVVLAGEDASSLDETLLRLALSGYRVQGDVADCGDKRQVEQLVERIQRVYGKIDILVNAWEQFEPSLAENVSPDAWRQALRVHIKAVFLACQVVGRLMLRQRAGSIINLSSVAGSLGFPQTVAFAACKGGVEQLTRVLGAEWIGRGVRVNAIAAWSDGFQPDEESGFRPDARIPLGRFTTPAELGAAAVYLASSASAAMSGHIMHIDGGYAAQ